MQSTRNKNYHSLQIIFIVLILLQIAFIAFADNPIIPLITSVFLLAVFFLLCRFWINFVIPQENEIKSLSQMSTLFLSLFAGKESVLSIKDGKSQQDYFLLKRTPAIKSVFVHQNSTALTQRSNGKLRLLAAGFNPVRNAEKVILTFDLRMQYFIHGPLEGDSPFHHKRSGESYTDFHARQLRAEKVKSQTKDGTLLYPSFKIYYQLVSVSDQDSEDKWFSVNQIGKFLSEKGFKGAARDPINDQLGCDIAVCWTEQVSHTTYAEILSADNESHLNNIMDNINRQFSKQTFSEIRKKENRYPTSSWAIPYLKVYLHDLYIQKSGEKIGQGEDE